MRIHIREMVSFESFNTRGQFFIVFFIILVFLRKRKDGKPEIVLLDHGLYEHLSPSTRLSLCQFWEAIVLKDQEKMNKFAKELNVNG